MWLKNQIVTRVMRAAIHISVLTVLVVGHLLVGCSSKQPRVVEQDIEVPSQPAPTSVLADEITTMPLQKSPSIGFSLPSRDQMPPTDMPAMSERIEHPESTDPELSEVEQILNSTPGVSRPAHEAKAREQVLQDLLQE